MPYRASFIVQNAVIFIAGLPGTTGKHSIVWRCVTRMEQGQGSCNAPTVQETDLQNAVVSTKYRQKWWQNLEDSVIEKLQQNIEMVINRTDDTSAENIDIQLECLQKDLLECANAKEDYNDIADEIFRLRELKQNTLVDNAEREGLKYLVAEMKEFLNGQDLEIETYDEPLVRRLIEKIIICSDRFKVEFKTKIEVDVLTKFA